MYKYKLNAVDTFEGTYNGDRDMQELIATGDKIIGWNGIDALAKIRPTESEVDGLWVDFRHAWDKDFRDDPRKPRISMIFTNGYLDL